MTINDIKWGFWQCCWIYQNDNRTICIKSNVSDDLKSVNVYLQDIETRIVKGEKRLVHPPFIPKTKIKISNYLTNSNLTQKQMCFETLLNYLKESKL